MAMASCRCASDQTSAATVAASSFHKLALFEEEKDVHDDTLWLYHDSALMFVDAGGTTSRR